MLVPLTSVVFSAFLGEMPYMQHPASRGTAVVVSAASADSLLTVDVLTRMTAFWTAFMNEPSTVTGAGRQAHQKPLAIDVGGSSPLQLPSVVDMTAMATAFPSVTADLTQAHLTGSQWEQYRVALFAAVLATQQAVTPAASSAVAQNMAFLQAHPQEFAALQATGMWLPILAAAQNSQPTTFAAIQAQDQAETRTNNAFVASNGPIASPRDTARTTIGRAHVLIDYGRPSKRGRVIFGDLVPYNQVWRTGANMATTLVTDNALTIGSLTVPAGSYTLYTIPSATGWQLIINKENGQWGLTYHPEFDVGRVPMTVSIAKSPVETFLIAFAKGTLQLRWDTTVVSVPMADKQ